jgi:acetyltransferase-like isoleucine patch superfamily enzyme
MRTLWKLLIKKLKSNPLPMPLMAVYLMVKWQCFVHPSARIAYPMQLKIGKGAKLGRCVISIAGRAKQGKCYAVEIGADSVIHDSTIIATHGGYVHIGSRVTLHPFSVIYGYGGVVIGDGTRIATSTVIVASTHGMDDPCSKIADSWSGEGITIGEDVWLGAGVRVLDGTTVGNRSVIGAGAVVTKDIPAASVAVGVPAIVVKHRFSE